jgi:hypothetical protein
MQRWQKELSLSPPNVVHIGTTGFKRYREEGRKRVLPSTRGGAFA